MLGNMCVDSSTHMLLVCVGAGARVTSGKERKAIFVMQNFKILLVFQIGTPKANRTVLITLLFLRVKHFANRKLFR